MYNPKQKKKAKPPKQDGEHLLNSMSTNDSSSSHPAIASLKSLSQSNNIEPRRKQPTKGIHSSVHLLAKPTPSNLTSTNRFLCDLSKGVQGRPREREREKLGEIEREQSIRMEGNSLEVKRERKGKNEDFDDEMKKIGIDTSTISNEKLKLSFNHGKSRNNSPVDRSVSFLSHSPLFSPNQFQLRNRIGGIPAMSHSNFNFGGVGDTSDFKNQPQNTYNPAIIPQSLSRNPQISAQMPYHSSNPSTDSYVLPFRRRGGISPKVIAEKIKSPQFLKSKVNSPVKVQSPNISFLPGVSTLNHSYNRKHQQANSHSSHRKRSSHSVDKHSEKKKRLTVHKSESVKFQNPFSLKRKTGKENMRNDNNQLRTNQILKISSKLGENTLLSPNALQNINLFANEKQRKSYSFNSPHKLNGFLEFLKRQHLNKNKKKFTNFLMGPKCSIHPAEAKTSEELEISVSESELESVDESFCLSNRVPVINN